MPKAQRGHLDQENLAESPTGAHTGAALTSAAGLPPLIEQ